MTHDTLKLLKELFFNWNTLAESSQVNLLDQVRRLRRGNYPPTIEREFERLIEAARERGVPLDPGDE